MPSPQQINPVTENGNNHVGLQQPWKQWLGQEIQARQEAEASEEASEVQERLRREYEAGLMGRSDSPDNKTG